MERPPRLDRRVRTAGPGQRTHRHRMIMKEERETGTEENGDQSTEINHIDCPPLATLRRRRSREGARAARGKAQPLEDAPLDQEAKTPHTVQMNNYSLNHCFLKGEC